MTRLASQYESEILGAAQYVYNLLSRNAEVVWQSMKRPASPFLPTPKAKLDVITSTHRLLSPISSAPTDTMASSKHEKAAEDSKLVEKLAEMAKKNKRLVKSADYEAPAMPSMTITRWKLDEFKYNVVPCPFPTLARGLFTTKVGEPGKGEVTHKIVARGYDKFFNIGEVPWTTVRVLMTAIFAYYTKHLSSGMPFKSILLHPTT